uniref:Uncharacterized protein n=1 Tax=Pavo cristatus TaxID=9049 RepID=A0A8C9EPN1_PAVCR
CLWFAVFLDWKMPLFSLCDDTMTGDGGEYLRPEDLKELGDDSLPSSQFLDGMNYLRYSLEGGRSDRYLPGQISFLLL